MHYKYMICSAINLGFVIGFCNQPDGSDKKSIEEIYNNKFNKQRFSLKRIKQNSSRLY